MNAHLTRRYLTVSGALAILLLPGALWGQENQMCLVCHSNESFFADKDDPSRYVVTESTLARSIHGEVGLACTDCHRGLSFPHPEQVPRADCSACHDDQAIQHSQSLHGLAAARGDTLAPGCVDCHGGHDILASRDPRARTYVFNIPMLCGECHHEGTPVSRTHDIPQDRILENYSLSIHGEGLFRQGLAVTAVCTSCHTSHFILPHTDRRSSIHEDNVAETCTQCHALIEDVHRQVIEGRLWEAEPNKIPVCVDCHAPHKIRRVLYNAGAANQDCFRCHSDPELTMERDGETVSLFVDEAAYDASTHGGTGCAQCHTDVTPSTLFRPCTTSVASNVDCAICHAEEVELHETSTHGRLAAEGVADAPGCLDCHDEHVTLSHLNPISPTFPRNVPDLCARCHRAGEIAAKRIDYAGPDIVRSYIMSIHGKGLLESGLVVTATCSDCHTPHHQLPPDDPNSSVNPDNISNTCGTCHHGIEEEYRTSIHWAGRADFVPEEEERELPTCEDCHTSHTISRTDLGDFRLMMMDQCGRCHQDESETFFDTFHGKVSRLGDAGAAKCYDCHGTHNIHPVDDPRSTLSRRNIVETCAQCHPAANRRFTGYLTHATHHDQDKYPFLFWTFWGMTGLLVGTLGFATLHTGAWLYRLWRTPGEWKVGREAVGDRRLVRRFTTFERTLHLVMLLSFFTLALTGMALKFSYMGWAQSFAGALGGFATTGVLHRLGAITLITVFVIHLVDVYRRKQDSAKSWKEFIFSENSLIFNRSDAREFLQSVKWFFGFGPRPRYGRYTYWEKFDYFAVFWGMFIIGSTGLLLWFPELFTLILPGWTVNVATILHSDEALLAVAFIFTVHFFNTHFRPDKFPMDPVIFTGRVSVEELKRDKPREYEKLVEEGKLQQSIVQPYPKKLERLFRIFGYCALAVGLTLIALILYTMATTYL